MWPAIHYLISLCHALDWEYIVYPLWAQCPVRRHRELASFLYCEGTGRKVARTWPGWYLDPRPPSPQTVRNVFDFHAILSKEDIAFSVVEKIRNSTHCLENCLHHALWTRTTDTTASVHICTKSLHTDLDYISLAGDFFFFNNIIFLLNLWVFHMYPNSANFPAFPYPLSTLVTAPTKS